jgi:hypothetical protein
MLFYRPGQKHVAMRELMGQQASDTGGLLPDEWVSNFHDSCVNLEDRPRAIYLGIDPGGGGPGELGIIGIAETMSMQNGPKLAVGLLFFPLLDFSALCARCFYSTSSSVNSPS